MKKSSGLPWLAYFKTTEEAIEAVSEQYLKDLSENERLRLMDNFNRKQKIQKLSDNYLAKALLKKGV